LGAVEKKNGKQESADKNQKKKLERQEEKLKSSNRELSMVKNAYSKKLNSTT
jgi:hypothetical protein